MAGLPPIPLPEPNDLYARPQQPNNPPTDHDLRAGRHYLNAIEKLRGNMSVPDDLRLHPNSIFRSWIWNR